MPQVGLAGGVATALAQGVDDGGGGSFDAALELDGVGAGLDGPEAFANHRLCEHGRGCCSVASYAVGFGGNFLDELRAHVGEGISQLDLLGDGDAIVGDRRRSGQLLQHRVTAFGSQRHLDRIGQSVYAHFEQRSGVLAESEFFCHVARTLCVVVGGEEICRAPDQGMRIARPRTWPASRSSMADWKSSSRYLTVCRWTAPRAASTIRS